MEAGLVKLLLLFGIVLGLAVWELYRVTRSIDPATPDVDAGDDGSRGAPDADVDGRNPS